MNTLKTADAIREAKAALKLDLAQFVLDMVGIVDPTGAADVASAALSLWRNDWTGAALSFLGVFAGLGDLAKLGKLGKYSKAVEQAIELARVDKEFARLIYPQMKGLKGVFGRLPMDKLPEEFVHFVQRIKYQLDSFVKETPLINGAAARRASKEIVEAFPDMQLARNRAIAWLEEQGVEFGPHYRPIEGKFGGSQGKGVGIESTKGPLWSIRIDFDPFKGPHYNASLGKGATGAKRAFTFPAAHNVYPEKWIESIISRLGDPLKRPLSKERRPRT